MNIEQILAAEIERLEKNYGYRYRFILIARDKDEIRVVHRLLKVSLCTSPMTENCRGAMLMAAARMP